MDPHRIALAETCLNAAHEGSISFPDIVGALTEAGFDGYIVDYRRDTTTYFLPDGDSHVLPNHPSGGMVAAVFDRAGIAARIRWAQSGDPGYTYAAFSARVKALGCAGYIVSFPGRRVLYFGRTPETQVEHVPACATRARRRLRDALAARASLRAGRIGSRPSRDSPRPSAPPACGRHGHRRGHPRPGPARSSRRAAGRAGQRCP